MLKKLSKITIGLVLLLTLPIAVSATVYVDGGEWKYGVCLSHTCGFSDYYHDNNWHSSTVAHPNVGNAYRSAAPGSWSQAKLHKIPPTGMSYYYNLW